MPFSSLRRTIPAAMRSLLLAPLAAFCLTSCAALDPHQVDVELPADIPEVKVSSFDQPLADLGKMSQVYGKRAMIQGKDIVDLTGLSQYGFGEIPRDITEMTKSALNAIGGNVVYIPYNPVFINNNVVTGYSNFQSKYIPDVVLSGGITEFDRGLETRGKNFDVGVTTRPFNVDESWVPGDTISLDWNQGDKNSLARITLDFNLLDFRTMSGVARMQTVNSINVHKALAEKELGFTIFGPTFGLKGTVKKVQGRHAAIRLLVQSSVIQVVGKYLYLPYWKLLPGAQPDPVVLDRIRQDYLALNQKDRLAELQTCLYLKGYEVSVDGQMDTRTKAALASFKPGYDSSIGTSDPDLYIELWSSLGDNIDQTAVRRDLLVKNIDRENARERVAKTEVPKAPKKVTKESDEKAASKGSKGGKGAPGPTAIAATQPKAPAAEPAVAAPDLATMADRKAPEKKDKTPLVSSNAPPEVYPLPRTINPLGGTYSAEAFLNGRQAY
jgi:hypothetical protein